MVIDGILYELDSNTATAAVSGIEYISVLVIPPVIAFDEQTYRVTSIADSAFENRDGLTSVTIPASLGDHLFTGCERLSAIIVNENNPIYDSRNHCNAIIETAANALIAGCMNTIIPDSITSIPGRCCCYRCLRLQRLPRPYFHHYPQ